MVSTAEKFPYLVCAQEGLYGDFSCAMGFCCTLRCMNPPHNWVLGWGDEINAGGYNAWVPDDPLTSAPTPSDGSLQPGETRFFMIPAQITSPQHLVSRLPCLCALSSVPACTGS
jgi:hypothetical protein